MNIPREIATLLKINEEQVLSTIALLNEDATVPFIARYRKEKTGGLDEEQIREIEDKFTYFNLLENRKETVIKSIDEQGKLTDELKNKILSAFKLQEVEDLYLPYKPKRKTRGTIAKAKGLEPLAVFIINNPGFSDDFEEILNQYINDKNGVSTTEEALQGAKDIIAEMISDDANVRGTVRNYFLDNTSIVSQKAKIKSEDQSKKKKDVYDIYHDFKIELSKIKPYQLLAINRGEREKFIKVNFSFEKDELLTKVFESFFNYRESTFLNILNETVDDSFNRLINPSVEREVRNQLTEIADQHAIEIFASNLRQLLLQPPLLNKTIMGIDPGFVSGSKVAVIDATGKYLEGITIYPHPPQKKVGAAKENILRLITKYEVELIAIGNGTASRETEILVADLITEKDLDCHYLIVSEAGASVYSASPVAKQEFPELEASQRGNISIARRVLDPLAELVKIDPKSIGVGLYQHDVDQKSLRKKLDDVVISCVNYVGVDLNTASGSLLTYVSGLNKRLANNIVKYREKNGRFNNRNELAKVSGIGDKSFEQAAGFLKISDGENPLDNTFIHPESYGAAQKLLELVSLNPNELKEKSKGVSLYVDQKGILQVAENIGVGEPTLKDILENLMKPGRDPRDDMPKPILRSDVLKIEDLSEGLILKGTVRNIVDFGAFIDIGVKESGLLHISQITDKFIKHPIEVISVGDILDVTVISIDIDKGRISLSTK